MTLAARLISDDVSSGATIVGLDGATIGTVDDVYSDSTTGDVRWGTVTRAGHRHVVALAERRVLYGEIWVPFTVEDVLAAPHEDPATALTQDDEHDLDRHYESSPFWGRPGPRSQRRGDGSAQYRVCPSATLQC